MLYILLLSQEILGIAFQMLSGFSKPAFEIGGIYYDALSFLNASASCADLNIKQRQPWTPTCS